MPQIPSSKPAFALSEWVLIVILASVNFLNLLDFVIIMPLGDTLRVTLKITPEQFSHVVSVYGFAAVFAGILATTFADRLDRKTTLLMTLFGFLASTFLCGIVHSYNSLLIARGMAG